MNRICLGLLGMLLLGSACKREETSFPASDPRLDTRTYCNDPEAVNFNWNFPGRPDNSTCIYPSGLFAGTYSYIDTVFFPDGALDTLGSQQAYTLRMTADGKTKIRLSGLCSATELRLTAPRTGYIATFDTTVAKGQLYCRTQDTLTGRLTRELADTARLQIEFTVVSDTATNLHKGTAYRLP